MDTPFETAVARWVWHSKYRRDGEQSPADSFRRVARAIAAAEAAGAAAWEARFLALLQAGRFLPGGRILANAGSGGAATWCNCFAMGLIDDSLDGIFAALKEGALTLQAGGGIGYDFSTLRPAGSTAWQGGGAAAGPVPFLDLWDSLCASLSSSGSRRGAMMACLRIDHPDIEAFIEAKRQAGSLSHFNLSVLASDAFMAALEQDADWPLLFPAEAGQAGEILERSWPGHARTVPCLVQRRLPARALWQRLMQTAYQGAEPGVLFIDRINHDNNLRYRERLHATNPCGEIPLPPYGVCSLGSLNLAAFVLQPFTSAARWDLPGLAAAAALAVRLLDNVLELSHYPLAAQQRQALDTRRLGLGITGLADALVMLGLPYGEDAARQAALQAMEAIKLAAYGASVELAREKGPFPAWDGRKYLAAPFIRALPGKLRERIASQGIRNSHMLAIAPTGSISLLADGISSGLEPLFARRYRRCVAGREYALEPYCLRLWRQRGHAGEPPALATAEAISPTEQLAMQAALQSQVDNAIAKTVQVPADYAYADFQSLYQTAYRLGLKGCASYRPNPLRGAVLSSEGAPQAGCCGA